MYAIKDERSFNLALLGMIDDGLLADALSLIILHRIFIHPMTEQAFILTCRRPEFQLPLN